MNGSRYGHWTQTRRWPSAPENERTQQRVPVLQGVAEHAGLAVHAAIREARLLDREAMLWRARAPPADRFLRLTPNRCRVADGREDSCYQRWRISS